MTVKTIKSAGGDFTTLSAWEAAQAATLTAPAEAECYNFALTNNFAISGITTSAANYIRIYAPLAERHDGRARAVSGTGFRISESAAFGTVRIAANHVRLEGLEIEHTGTNQPIIMASALAAGANDIRIEKCLIHDVATGTSYTVDATATNLNLTIRNSIVYGTRRSMNSTGATAVTVENSTFWRHAAQLGLVCNSELSCKNVYSGHAGAAAEDFYTGGSPASGNNNASSDTSQATDYTAGVSNVAGSAVFTSVTSGAEDFTLLSGTNALVDVGATLGTVTDDIIGTARPQNSVYDIGAFERIAAGGGSSGTSTTTNSADTSSAAGATTITGTLATTNTNDTSAAVGTTRITGSAATTNASDAAQASGIAEQIAPELTVVTAANSGPGSASFGVSPSTTAFNLVAGRHVFVWFAEYCNTLPVSTVAISDTAGNTYTALGPRTNSIVDPGGGAKYEHGGWWYCLNAAGNAANVVTATCTASTAQNRVVYAIQVSGTLPAVSVSDVYSVGYQVAPFVVMSAAPGFNPGPGAMALIGMSAVSANETVKTWTQSSGGTLTITDRSDSIQTAGVATAPVPIDSAGVIGKTFGYTSANAGLTQGGMIQILLAGPTISPPVASASTATGGYYEGVPRRRSVREERERLGIIPREVKKVITAVARASVVAQKTDAQAERQLQQRLDQQDIEAKARYVELMRQERDRLLSRDIAIALRIRMKQAADEDDDERASELLLL